MVPCTVLCLLALSLDFRPSPDIQKCSYCAQMRGLSLGCEQKPLACAELDPDSLIYCLSRDERPWGRDALKRSTRCISHANLFNQSLLITGRALAQGLALIPAADHHQQQCAFEAAQECQCPDCTFEVIGEGKGRSEVELAEGKDEPPVDLATELQSIALLLDKLIVEEGQQQKDPSGMVESATRKNSRRTLPPKLLAGAAAPLRPLAPRMQSQGRAQQQQIIPFPMDFLRFSSSSQPQQQKHWCLLITLSLLLLWPIHFAVGRFWFL